MKIPTETFSKETSIKKAKMVAAAVGIMKAPKDNISGSNISGVV
jgi:hypothetical protein